MFRRKSLTKPPFSQNPSPFASSPKKNMGFEPFFWSQKNRAQKLDFRHFLKLTSSMQFRKNAALASWRCWRINWKSRPAFNQWCSTSRGPESNPKLLKHRKNCDPWPFGGIMQHENSQKFSKVWSSSFIPKIKSPEQAKTYKQKLAKCSEFPAFSSNCFRSQLSHLFQGLLRHLFCTVA